jgi:hypothetical protein
MLMRHPIVNMRRIARKAERMVEVEVVTVQR